MSFLFLGLTVLCNLHLWNESPNQGTSQPKAQMVYWNKEMSIIVIYSACSLQDKLQTFCPKHQNNQILHITKVFLETWWVIRIKNFAYFFPWSILPFWGFGQVCSLCPELLIYHIYVVKHTNEKTDSLGSSFLKILYNVTTDIWSWKILLKRSLRDKRLEEKEIKGLL